MQTAAIIAVFLSAIGVVMNSLVLLVTVADYRGKKTLSHGWLNMIILSLNVSDIFLVTATFFGLIAVDGDYRNAAVWQMHVNAWITIVMSSATHFTLAVLAYSRYAIVVKDKFITRTYIAKWLALSWAIAFLGAIISEAMQMYSITASGLYGMVRFGLDTWEEAIFSIMPLLTALFVNTIMIMCYYKIYQQVKQLSQQSEINGLTLTSNAADNSKNQIELERKILRGCIIVVVSYFISSAPVAIEILVTMATGELYRSLSAVAFIFFVLNSVTNPFIYFIFILQYSAALVVEFPIFGKCIQVDAKYLSNSSGRSRVDSNQQLQISKEMHHV